MLVYSIIIIMLNDHYYVIYFPINIVINNDYKCNLQFYFEGK